MLQNMYNRATKWLVWIIVVILITALGFWGIGYYFIDGNATKPAVAKINGIRITQAEFRVAYNRLQQEQPKLFNTPDASTKIKQRLLQSFITEAVLAQAALKQGFSISDQQVNSLIMKIPAFQVNGKFSPAQFSMVLNRASFTPQQFMQNLRTSLLINQLYNGIVASAFALPREIKELNMLIQQKRDIGYLIIPASRFLPYIKITPQQVKTFYQQHQTDFSTPEKLSIAYVEISPKIIAESIKPSKAELERYYNNNLSNYTTPTHWHVAHILLHTSEQADAKQISTLKAKLTKIRMQAEKGTAFATLVKQYSEDIFTVNKRGEMPWFSPGSLDPIFEKTVHGLKVGQISSPVHTLYGMELIKLLEVQPKQIKTFSQVMPQVKKAYVNQQLVSTMANQKEALANLTFENPDSLQPAAKQLHLSIKTTPLVTRRGTKTGITANANIMVTAFSDNVLQQRNNSDVITLKDGTLVVLRVQQYVAATIKPLTAVKQLIKQQLSTQQASQQAKRLGDNLLPEITTHTNTKALALKHKLHWVTKIDIGRQAKNVSPLMLQQIFSMPAPTIAGKLSTRAMMLPNGDYALVAVTKVHVDNSQKLISAQTQLLQQQLTSMFASAAYDAYANMQQQQTKVKVYANNL